MSLLNSHLKLVPHVQRDSAWWDVAMYDLGVCSVGMHSKSMHCVGSAQLGTWIVHSLGVYVQNMTLAVQN